MFKTGEDYPSENILSALHDAEANYKIQKNDYLTVEVYTNKGERIIDPNFELMKEMQGSQMLSRSVPNYLVQENGFVKLPIVDTVKLEGLTLFQSDSLLQLKYSAFYQDPFVITKYINKRVIVLGATGGQVIPIRNENTNLVEVLAIAGGVQENGKVHNIRLIRGDLKNPEVQVIDLSTIAGMKKASLKIHPGDIIYVEPVRRPFLESIRDVSPVLSLVTSLITFAVLIQSLNERGN